MCRFGLAAAMSALLCIPGVAFGVLYSQDFNVDDSANWIINDPGLSDIAVDFFYDYSAIGVPAAPNGTGTRGMKLTANNFSGVFSGFSVSPKGQNFTGDYTVSFDLWQNYVGPLGGGGSGSTQLSMFGIGSSGTVPVWPGSNKESVTFAVTLDGQSSSDYRVYSSAAHTSYPAGSAVYAAPGGAVNGSDAYYQNAFASVSAPAEQVAIYSSQTGMTDPGEIAFQWRRVVIDVSDGVATWTIDGVLIATVDLSGLTLGGGNILFGHSDTNATSSVDPNAALLNVTIIDNIVVTPEPATAGLLLVSGLFLLRRRRA
ncbi:MAG TPA: PEP-CTERM sorting domain-containing protein [Phycisphaerae bacterium]|nr:PEP-CTERM sorting domain-containing protein [Phycisphaerae bacterium]HOJ74181.1 PEP-CTERM sorting domain-containing protein [Phycisphaerae bacterium]HOM51259.1 PEP-CTERM sorting domain-containing protein [Phycisphaerae bacterium]HON67555.1 PEP-CTERM sorting domain-containing protein [Phycisphaerae bacterium]HOQ87155.1 PEP-CTERM sorting domain-containing protein [Phycisphaerae bacterium]